MAHPAETAEADLLLRIAASPRDRRAHRDLARLMFASERFGVALRHFEAAGRARGRADDDTLTDLYLRRARARLDHGDLGAHADLEAIARLGRAPVSIDRSLTSRALYAAALSAYRRADRRGRAEGAALLERARAAFGPDPRLAAIKPELAAVADIGTAAAWLAEGDARRVALDLYRTYAARGGRDDKHARGHRALERWWGSAGATEADEVLTAGAVGPALIDALEGWLLAGAPSWRAELEHRLPPDLDAEVLPPFARATVLRWQNRNSRAALEASLVALDTAADGERAVIIAEALISGVSPATLVDQARGPLAVLALARGARASDDGETTRAVLATATPALRRSHHLAGAELFALAGLGSEPARHALARLALVAPAPAAALGARWHAMGHVAPTPRKGWIAPIGVVDAVRLAADFGSSDDVGALVHISRVYRAEPVLAERLASEWIDRRVAVVERAPIIVELFGRAGDPSRALRVAERWLAANPDHPRALRTAAIWAAAAGDEARARILAAKAAARSGDAGRTWRVLTAAFLEVGSRLAAISAGRSALSLSAPHHHRELKTLIARAMLRLGRVADARELLQGVPGASAVLASRGEPRTRTAADAELLAARPHDQLEALATDVSLPAAALALWKVTGSSASRQALASAAAWNPTDVEVLEALASSSHERAGWARAQLVAVALSPSLADREPATASAERGGAAMRAWARRLDAEGNGALADAVRREGVTSAATRLR